MVQHHVQKSIILKLLFSDALRFSELKPDTLDNKLFDYHLKNVIREGFVEKDTDGTYCLTKKGKREGSLLGRTTLKDYELAESVLFLVVKRKSDGAWLFYTRLTHPLKDLSGFMHTVPNATEKIHMTAKNELKLKTGLSGDFTVAGSGYFRVYSGDELESFTHFTMLVCEDATGELINTGEKADYSWVTSPDFFSKTMLPNMKLLVKAYETKSTFFIDETLHL